MIIVLVEVFALVAVTVTAIAINPQTAQIMAAASQAANADQTAWQKARSSGRSPSGFRPVT